MIHQLNITKITKKDYKKYVFQKSIKNFLFEKFFFPGNYIFLSGQFVFYRKVYEIFSFEKFFFG